MSFLSLKKKMFELFCEPQTAITRFLISKPHLPFKECKVHDTNVGI